MRKLAFTLICLCSSVVYAQDGRVANQISLSGALDSNSAWEVGLSYMRKISSWFGVGVGANVYSQYSGEIKASGENMQGTSISEWILGGNSGRVAGIQINPFVHLSTPSLFSFQGADFTVYAEPGLLLSLSSNKCGVVFWDGRGYYVTRMYRGKSGDWFSGICRLGVSLENEYGVFNLGYFLSDFDMYSFKRSIRIGATVLGDYMPNKHTNWGIYIVVP